MDDTERSTEVNEETRPRRLSRRNLLAQAGVIAATTELGASTLAGCGSDSKSSAAPLAGDTNNTVAPFPPPSRPIDARILSFFTAHEASTVDAITSRLIPGDASDPGAHEAAVPAYIDQKLAHFATFSVPTYFHPPFASPVNHHVGPQEPVTGAAIKVETAQLVRYGFQSSLTPQETYRKGIELLDGYSQLKHNKRFIELDHATQDAILSDLEADKVKYFTTPTGLGFFETLLEDAYEGMFADPLYGGNRGFAGWKLIGYPGAQRAYTAYELENGPQNKQVQGLRDMPPMNPGRPAGNAILPMSGSPMLAEGGQ